jgi:hypothetical protein
MFRLRTPKFISLKSDQSLFTTNVKPKPSQPTPNTSQELNAFINASTSSSKAPWTWWSAVMWVIFALGFALIIAGFFKSLTTKNTLSDGTKKDKPFKDLAVAMLVIGFVLCFLPFIVSIVTGIRMF